MHFLSVTIQTLLKCLEKFESQQGRTKRQRTLYAYISSTTFVLYKGKVFPVNTVKPFKGRRIIALLRVNLGARRRSVVNVTPCPLYPTERSSEKLNMRLRGSHSRSGRCKEEKNSLTSTRIRTPDRAFRS